MSDCRYHADVVRRLTERGSLAFHTCCLCKKGVDIESSKFGMFACVKELQANQKVECEKDKKAMCSECVWISVNLEFGLRRIR